MDERINYQDGFIMVECLGTELAIDPMAIKWNEINLFPIPKERVTIILYAWKDGTSVFIRNDKFNGLFTNV